MREQLWWLLAMTIATASYMLDRIILTRNAHTQRAYSFVAATIACFLLVCIHRVFIAPLDIALIHWTGVCIIDAFAVAAAFGALNIARGAAGLTVVIALAAVPAAFFWPALLS